MLFVVFMFWVFVCCLLVCLFCLLCVCCFYWLLLKLFTYDGLVFSLVFVCGYFDAVLLECRDCFIFLTYVWHLMFTSCLVIWVCYLTIVLLIAFSDLCCFIVVFGLLYRFGFVTFELGWFLRLACVDFYCLGFCVCLFVEFCWRLFTF